MIGVFDSGFGGLTVHRALIEALPERDFVYLGDNRNAPYGTRPPIDVLNLTCAGLERLFDEGCTLAIVACNTASVVALRWIQQQWLPARRHEDGVPRNAIGIVVPTIEAATGLGWHEEPAAAGNDGPVQHHRGFRHPPHGGDRLLPNRDPQAPSRHHRGATGLPRTCRLNRAGRAAPATFAPSSNSTWTNCCKRSTTRPTA